MDAITIAVLFLPVLFIVLLVYIILRNFTKNSELRYRYELRSKASKDMLANRLQAYERMTLFLERIKPSFQITQFTTEGNADTYLFVIIENIQKEFEYNWSQRIYMSSEAWQIIRAAKNATQNFLRDCQNTVNSTENQIDKTNEEVNNEIDKGNSAQLLKDEIIRRIEDGNAPAEAALVYLQKEIQGEI